MLLMPLTALKQGDTDLAIAFDLYCTCKSEEPSAVCVLPRLLMKLTNGVARCAGPVCLFKLSLIYCLSSSFPGFAMRAAFGHERATPLEAVC